MDVGLAGGAGVEANSSGVRCLELSELSVKEDQGSVDRMVEHTEADTSGVLFGGPGVETSRLGMSHASRASSQLVLLLREVFSNGVGNGCGLL